MFSPYYAWARRRGEVDPMDHVAINVALYGQGGKRWTMTERSARSVDRGPSHLRIGKSLLFWDRGRLTLNLDEWTVPWPSRLRGTIKLTPTSLPGARRPLDAAGRHGWQPIAPCAHVEVDLQQPSSRWSGHGYFDCNDGSAPLEQDFTRWHWSRNRTKSGVTSVLYDVARRDGSALELALRFDGDGSARELDIEPPPLCALPLSRWRIRRDTRSDSACPAQVVSTLEDGPFYARSLVRACVNGEGVTAIHESLDLDRFASPWVQAMLPFRMPRRR